MNQPEFRIHSSRHDEFIDALDKLNKRADKLGVEHVGFDTLREEHENGETYYIVTVSGKAPKLNGWQFVATLEHDEGATIIRRIPTFEAEIDLTQYRSASPEDCDQCGYKRRRNDTYVVAYEDGRTAQVGSSCLKDFVGHQSPEQIARFMELVADFIERDFSGGGGGGETRYRTQTVIQDAVTMIRKYGWVSKKQAQDSYDAKISTAQFVTNNIFDRERRSPHGWEDPSTEDCQLAAKVIEWVRELDEEALKSDYLYNLFAVLKNDSIRFRQFGIAVSAVSAYERAMEREIKRAAAKAQVKDEFLGVKDDKIEVEAVVTRVFTYDNDYGSSHKHIMVDGEGHQIVWQTGTERFEQGTVLKAGFKVKATEDTKYGKQTIVFYPRNLEVKEPVA